MTQHIPTDASTSQTEPAQQPGETIFDVYRNDTENGTNKCLFGCDGTSHAVVSLSFVEGSEYPSDHVTTTLGPCDGTCAEALAECNRGWFRHTV